MALKASQTHVKINTYAIVLQNLMRKAIIPLTGETDGAARRLADACKNRYKT
jgi:hypothetical protein